MPPNCGSFSEKQTENYCAPGFRNYTHFLHIFPGLPEIYGAKISSHSQSQTSLLLHADRREISDNKLHLTPFFCAFSVAIFIAVGELSTPITSNPWSARYIASCRRRNRDQWSCRDGLFHFEPAQKANPGVPRYFREFYQAVLSGEAQKRTATNEKPILRLWYHLRLAESLPKAIRRTTI